MLCIGIDIGKKSHHVALYLSERRKKNPVISVASERAGFEELLCRMQEHAPRRECRVLLEATGHYGATLIQFLQEHEITIYRISPKARYGANASKSDPDDARMLATLLYQQIVKGVLPLEKSWHVRKLIPPSPGARRLRGLVQLRLELSRERARRTNKLIAIRDELFPESAQILSGIGSLSALALFTAFPDPQEIARADLSALLAARPGRYPSKKRMEQLQQLAQTTIGTKDPARRLCLLVEQKILLAQYQQHERDIDFLDKEIEKALLGSREGQILSSFIGIGATNAATLIAHIGSIANFRTHQELRAFLGWAPRRAQTGTSYNSESLDRKRNRPMRSMMYLIVTNATRYDPYWKEYYERVIPLKCIYDGRTKEWKGKMKVIGMIAGRLIKIIFTLLKRDADLIAAMEGKEEPLPPPELYDPLKIGKHPPTPAPEAEA